MKLMSTAAENGRSKTAVAKDALTERRVQRRASQSKAERITKNQACAVRPLAGSQLGDDRPPPLNGGVDVDETFAPRSRPELLAPKRRPAPREQSSRGLRLRIGDLCQRRLAASHFPS